MNEVYLDNAATTMTSLNSANKAFEVMTKIYGNPSSLHKKGLEAEIEIKKSKSILADILKCETDEIYFTSGGTESNNIAILGTAYAYKRSGKHIITTKIEHPSILEPFKFLEEQGFCISYLDTDCNGIVNIDSLKNSIRDDTVLVSIIHVNNEIGSVQNIEQIGTLIKSLNKNILFHVDAVQAFGKYDINVNKFKIDLLSISGHKIHAPKGIGVLYKRNKLKTKSLIFGGGQQNNFRSGTENVSGIAALGVAADEAYQNINHNFDYVKNLKLKMAKELLDMGSTCLNGDIEKCSPYILNISFKNIKSEVLLHSLEMKGISVSSGSACSSHKKQISNTLNSINASNIEGAIRFSFSHYNTISEIEYSIQIIKDSVATLIY